MIKVLEKTGCIVSYNPNQTCCGQPAFNAGFWDQAKDVCTKFIKDFVQRIRLETMIILSRPVQVVLVLSAIIIQSSSITHHFIMK